ncbi:hypothetical protein HMPREF1421_00749 [Helicobacter pylori GAM265BSii]|uniref:Uncharacterized protein n=1 Tax=Helicobacter pylori GAM265BSii TaxID=1159049 RepID=M3NL32_HELPX|nr:hypothetical protein HMPREF1421_00749 [Helicobacter pylori GAM265BSii]
MVLVQSHALEKAFLIFKSHLIVLACFYRVRIKSRSPPNFYFARD